MELTVIIPAKNEEKSIKEVIESMKDKLPNAEILVVDNGSCDKTSEIVKGNGVKVIKEPKKGKGNAMRLGAGTAKGEILIFIDGDGSYSSQNISDLINPILNEGIDIVYGSRFLSNSKRRIGLIRYVGNKIFSFLGSLLFQKTTDFLTGFFAIKRNKFLELNLKSDGFEIETEIFAKAVIKGLKIKEVPIEYIKNGDSKLNH